jgi:ketosteroid isomerase-like protein
LELIVRGIIFDGRDRAAVELKAMDVAYKNGSAFTNGYVWVCHFNEDNKIVKINAFMNM